MKLYKFYGDFCAPCKVLSALLEKMELKVPIIEVNIEDDDEDLVTKYHIRNVPTLILVDKNETELARIVGTASEDAINKMISKYE
ncbi:MAG: thioredoxin family protein [Methanobrevibacter sp.]|nr:thioredoxin family protein [Methanobrevibacter sp.]